MYELMFAKKDYKIGETYRMKGTRSMNEDTKLECLRLAVEWCGKTTTDPVDIAKKFYEWVTSEDKPNTIEYEKTLKERE